MRHGTGWLVVAALALSASPAWAQRRVVWSSPISLLGGTGTGLAVDQADNLYVAENYNPYAAARGPLVSKITPTGERSIFVPPGVLGGVTGLAVGPDGSLYVSDGRGNGNLQPACGNRIWKVAPDGTRSQFATIANPTGLAFDSQGILHAVSFQDQAIYSYAPDGAQVGRYALPFSEGVYGIAIDHADNIFVGAFAVNRDAWGRKVYRITPTGEATVFVDPGFTDPYGLAFDPNGNLWVTYYNSLRLVRVAPDGTWTTFVGGWTNDDAANGIAFDSQGNLYFAVNGGRSTPQPAVIKVEGAAVPPVICGGDDDDDDDEDGEDEDGPHDGGHGNHGHHGHHGLGHDGTVMPDEDAPASLHGRYVIMPAKSREAMSCSQAGGGALAWGLVPVAFLLACRRRRRD